MRFIPSDPDVATLYKRIKDEDIDLQPDFQRGEVWTTSKKQRLIDSILREWVVPPILVIEHTSTSKQEVLDGQQRLVAIRDFLSNDFCVDGLIEPINSEIEALHGKTYSTLPEDWRRKIERFPLRVFRIVDYQSQEPAEIFFRLNQPTSLTAAEQRNAYFGAVRDQVKELVSYLGAQGIDKSFIGFSNSRMAYDDVLARICYHIEAHTLAVKVDASTLANLYRSGPAFSEPTIVTVRNAIRVFGGAKRYLDIPVRFNKATFSSWMLFVSKASNLAQTALTGELLASFMSYFETLRLTFKMTSDLGIDHTYESSQIEFDGLEKVLNIYIDRSSFRVADISSVLLRDLAIWKAFHAFIRKSGAEFPLSESGIDNLILKAELHLGSNSRDADQTIESIVRESKWGQLL